MSRAALSALVIVAGLTILCARPALAHDKWENGSAVPPWVKSMCCGPGDVHHIPPGAIHIRQDGYHIEGLDRVVPVDQALPSPDGGYWGFWNENAEPNPNIYCFFAPSAGT